MQRLIRAFVLAAHRVGGNMKQATLIILILLAGCTVTVQPGEEAVTKQELYKIFQARDAGHKVYRTAVADSFADVYKKLKAAEEGEK